MIPPGMCGYVSCRALQTFIEGIAGDREVSAGIPPTLVFYRGPEVPPSRPRTSVSWSFLSPIFSGRFGSEGDVEHPLANRRERAGRRQGAG